MDKFNYLKNLPEFVSVKNGLYVGDLKGYFNWRPLHTLPELDVMTFIKLVNEQGFDKPVQKESFSYQIPDNEEEKGCKSPLS
jgi:hypothetical protein